MDGAVKKRKFIPQFNWSSTSSMLWVLLALTAASVEPIMVKLGYRDGASPLQLLVYRNIFAAVTILVLTRRWQWLGWRRFGLVCSVAVLLLATNALVLFALQDMSAVSVITMMTTTPAFVAIVNQWRGRDILGVRFWLGFLVCFLGVLLTIDAFGTSINALPIMGIVALTLAVTSSTTYRTRMEMITKEVAPRDVSTNIFLINAALSTIVILPWIEPLKAESLPIAVWIGAAAALANLAFLSAIKLLGSTRMSIFDMLQRPLVIVGAAILLSEPISIWQGAGVIMVLLGVQWAKVQRKAPSEPATQETTRPTPATTAR